MFNNVLWDIIRGIRLLLIMISVWDVRMIVGIVVVISIVSSVIMG